MKWLIYWIAENEESFFILSFIFAFIGMGSLGFGQITLGIIFLVLFFASLITINWCVRYAIKHSKNIRL